MEPQSNVARDQLPVLKWFHAENRSGKWSVFVNCPNCLRCHRYPAGDGPDPETGRHVLFPCVIGGFILNK